MPDPEPGDNQRGHPDQQWLARVRAALDAWEQSPAARPTSSVLGGGAVAAAEVAFSERHHGRPSLLLPSATYALRVALQVAGVGPASEVLCAAVDWPSGAAAVASLGATPVPVPVDPGTLTIDPVAAAKARTGRTRALIACHLHGICADVPSLRDALPGVTVIEDAAQAFGCTLDGEPAGTLGDLAVLSLGPGKHIDAGEGGVLLCADEEAHAAAIAVACHPLRHLLAGIRDATPVTLIMRPHPMAAILALHALATWSAKPAMRAQEAARAALARAPGLRVLGDPGRHVNSSISVPVLLDDPEAAAPPGTWWSPSGASVLPGLPAADHTAAKDLLLRIRLATQCCSPLEEINGR